MSNAAVQSAPQPGRLGVVVANPGGIPEIVAMAAGLARAGALHRYVTQIGSANPRLPGVLDAALPEPVRGRLLRELQRRRLPAVLEARLVRHRATTLDVLTAACKRYQPLRPAYAGVLRRANARFDRQAAQEIPPDASAFIGAYTAALQSLRRCRSLDVSGYLEYPIAHHRYGEKLLDEEARLVPEFAGTLQSHRYPAWLAARLDREIALADHIFVLSSFQQRTFIESGVAAEKLIITPLGVDLDLFRPAPRCDDGRFRVLFCGQITQRKGISYLLDAVRRIADGRTELLFVGQTVGTDRPWRGRAGVRHLEHAARTDLPALYASADVLVLPSLIEGFGLTALEAMACGRPVIVSENTFASDVVREGIDGFIVPVRNTEVIAARLAWLRAHRDKGEQMGTAARRRASEFSWERYGERVVAVLRATGALPNIPATGVGERLRPTADRE